MIVRIVEMEINPERKNDVVKTFNEIKDSVRGFPGCHYVGLFEDVKDSSHVITYSVWDNEESLEKYRSSDIFKRNWTLLKAFFISKPKAYSLKLVNECMFLPCNR